MADPDVDVDLTGPDGAGFSADQPVAIGASAPLLDTKALQTDFAEPWVNRLPFEGTVATFTAADAASGLGDFSATIDWGDGSGTEPATITVNPSGGFSVQSSHSFSNQDGSEDGIFEVTLTVVGPDQSMSIAHELIELVNPPAEISSTNASGTAGEEFDDNLGWLYTSSDQSLDDYAVEIDWGDGTTSEAELDPYSNDEQDLKIMGDHTYDNGGSYRIILTATSDQGEISTSQALITIGEPSEYDLTNDLGYDPGPYDVAVVNEVYQPHVVPSGLDDFYDQDPSGISISVDWGDNETTDYSFDQIGPYFYNDYYYDYYYYGYYGIDAGAFGHTYQESGIYTVNYTVSGAGAADGSYSETVVVSDPALAASLDGYNGAYAGSPLFGTDPATGKAPIGYFSDSNTRLGADDFSAVVDWGDGTSSAGTVSNYYDNEFQVDANHTYAQYGIYDVILVVAARDGGTTVTEGTFTVYPSDVTGATITGTGVNTEVANGEDFSGTVATFTDADLNDDDVTATIEWGDGGDDGESEGTITESNGLFTVTGDHVYNINFGDTTINANEYVSITITNSQGVSSYVLSGITVTNPDFDESQVPSGSGYTTNLASGDVNPVGTTVFAAENQEFDGVVGYFQSSREGASAGDFEALIAWGDGTYSDGTVNSTQGDVFEVDGSHTYEERGTYQIAVYVLDTALVPSGSEAEYYYDYYYYDYYGYYNYEYYYYDYYYYDYYYGYYGYYGYSDYGNDFGDTLGSGNVPWFSIVSGANVQSETPSLAPGSPEDVTAGDELTDVVLATGSTHDGHDIDSYTALVAWGDGTSSPVVVESEDGQFEISGDHVYTKPGEYQVAVTLFDGVDEFVTAVAITVDPASGGPAPLDAEGLDIEGPAGEPFDDIPVATLTDLNPPHIGGLHSVIIDWGDHTTSEGEVEEGSGPHEYQVYGTHTYAHPGLYTIQVTVQDQNDTAVASSFATVTGDQIQATGMLVQANASYDNAVVAEFDDADLEDTAANFTASIAVGNGLPDIHGTVHGGDGQFYVTLGNADDYYYWDYYNYWYYDYYYGYDYYGFSVGSTMTVTVRSAGEVVAQADSSVINGNAVPVGSGSNYISTAALLPTPATGNQYPYYFKVTDWGDSSPVDDNGHSYTSPGTYTLSYEEYQYDRSDPSDPDDLGSGSIDVDVTELPLTPVSLGSVPINGTTGEELDEAPVFSFYSPIPDVSASDYTVRIDWGDGHTSTGWVEPVDDNVFDVYGDHVYDAAGSFAITALVVDQEGTNISGGQNAQISLNASGEDFAGFASVATGNVVLATIEDPDGADDASPTVVVDWGDGSVSTGTVSYEENDDEYDIEGNHAYGQEGTYNVVVEVTENGTVTEVGTEATIQSGWSLAGGAHQQPRRRHNRRPRPGPGCAQHRRTQHRGGPRLRPEPGHRRRRRSCAHV